METFDGSVPNLISKRTLEDIDSYLNVPYKDSENKVINGLGAFYNNYISPNLFPIIVISLLVIYLSIKYVLKKDREEKETIEEEKREKLDRVKKHIFKTDPEIAAQSNTNQSQSQPQSQPQSHTQSHTQTQSSPPSQSQQANTKISDDPDISELISDEYLLTNDSESDHNDIHNTELIHNEYMNNEFDKAAALIFNK